MDFVMHESTVTAKGQTTLPKDVRSILNVKPGDKVRYLLLDGEVRILKARPLASLKGLLKRDGQGAISLAEMEEVISEGARSRNGLSDTQ